MNPSAVVDIGHQALIVTAMIAAPMLLVALGAGLLIGMFQAATQINDATLSFIPKLLMLAATLFIAGHWMLSVLVDYTHDLISNIPGLLG